jgi:hypothetical protein
VVEGWTEKVSIGEWSMAVNASPFSVVTAFILDDATYGVLDSAVAPSELLRRPPMAYPTLPTFTAGAVLPAASLTTLKTAMQSAPHFKGIDWLRA